MALWGISSMMRTDWGTLYRASFARQWLMTAAANSSGSTSTPSLRTTRARPTSTHLSSGTPMTAASATSASSKITDSTSAGYTFSPPEMYMSFQRSTT